MELKIYFNPENTYLKKMVGKNIDVLFCDKCKTFKVLFMGMPISGKCEKCNIELVHCSIYVNGIFE